MLIYTLVPGSSPTSVTTLEAIVDTGYRGFVVLPADSVFIPLNLVGTQIFILSPNLKFTTQVKSSGGMGVIQHIHHYYFGK